MTTSRIHIWVKPNSEAKPVSVNAAENPAEYSLEPLQENSVEGIYILRKVGPPERDVLASALRESVLFLQRDEYKVIMRGSPDPREIVDTRYNDGDRRSEIRLKRIALPT